MITVGANVGICLPRASKSQTRKSKNNSCELKSKWNITHGKEHIKFKNTSLALS
jgi:hypothetical protein